MSFVMPIDEFAHAVGFVVQATGKDCAEVLNKAGLTAIIGGKGVKGALQRTKKADPGAIEGRLLADKLAIKIVMSRAKRKGEKLKKNEIARRVKALIRKRKSGASYTRGPGWNNAIIALGGRGVRTNRRFASSEARYGSGKLATPGDLVAIITNTAPAAERIGTTPLNLALQATARDMVAYGTRKIQATFDKVKP